MEDDDTVYVCCSRVRDQIKTIIEGSTKDICSVCKEEVWISPATKKTKDERAGVVLCLYCAEEKIKKEKDDKPKVEVSDDQVQEIIGQVHKEFHEKLKKAFEEL